MQCTFSLLLLLILIESITGNLYSGWWGWEERTWLGEINIPSFWMWAICAHNHKVSIWMRQYDGMRKTAEILVTTHKKSVFFIIIIIIIMSVVRLCVCASSDRADKVAFYDCMLHMYKLLISQISSLLCVTLVRQKKKLTTADRRGIIFFLPRSDREKCVWFSWAALLQ